MGESSSPALPLVMAPAGKTLTTASVAALAWTHATTLALSMTGEVLGEAARRRRLGAGGDGFLGGLTRLAQVDVEVDQAGRDDEAGAVNFFDCGLRIGDCGMIRNAAVDEKKVGDFVTLVGRVDHAAVAEKGGAHG